MSRTVRKTRYRGQPDQPRPPEFNRRGQARGTANFFVTFQLAIRFTHPAPILITFLLFSRQRFTELEMRKNLCQLRSRSTQKTDLRPAEFSSPQRLHGQYP